jgi:hypothetical protein
VGQQNSQEEEKLMPDLISLVEAHAQNYQELRSRGLTEEQIGRIRNGEAIF